MCTLVSVCVGGLVVDSCGLVTLWGCCFVFSWFDCRFMFWSLCISACVGLAV